MIERYSLPEMKAVWGEETKLATWQEIEALALEGWAALGVAPSEAAAAVRAAPPVDPEAWRRREAETRHDVAAFVDVLADGMAEHANWLHFGMTSSDLLDTAQAVAMRNATTQLITRVDALFTTVRQRALEHRDTLMVGRTHGIWAEPTTFGLKLAGWAFELQRAHARLVAARDEVAFGKLSGAVGSYATIPHQVEAHVCARLGLAVEPAATQVTPRDRHARLVTTLAVVGASLERFATEIRHLQRSEVAEVREPFGSGQKGSSAMPHKRNPILSENVTGLARLLRGYAQAAMENVALWHERDISHSSAERVLLPDACLALDFALARMERVVAGLVVDDARMAANLAATRGLVHSQAVLTALVATGMARDDAYRLVQRHALAVADGGGDLGDALAADPATPLSPEELSACFGAERLRERSAVVFDRLSAVDL